MDSYQQTVGDTGSISGRGMLELKNGMLEAPESIIMTVQAAKTYYNNYKTTHIPRIIFYASIEGLIAGNPPFDPVKIKALGLSHITNVNTLDAKAMFERSALTFWNLDNQCANAVVFTVHPTETAQDQDFSGWGEILSRNWTKVIREKWPGYTKQMNILISYLVKFGYAPLIWPDENDFRWKAVDVSRFFCADQTSVDTEEWDCVCIETPFTISFLYSTYLEMKKKLDAGVDEKDIPWNVN